MLVPVLTVPVGHDLVHLVSLLTGSVNDTKPVEHDVQILDVAEGQVAQPWTAQV